jgi:SAM-dependent methyltransferase
LPAERRREVQPVVELLERVRRDEGWRAVPGLPQVPADHPHAASWRARARRFREGLRFAGQGLGDGPWRVLEVGAGSCWASAQLLAAGHQVAAVDLSLDPEDGLLAAERFLPPEAGLPRAEADMEALPLEAGRFELVLAIDALHYAPRLVRTLVELRRVLQRRGALLVLESPVYSRREDGEAAVAREMRRLRRRYAIDLPRESLPGYLVHSELMATFGAAGFRLEIHGSGGRSRVFWDRLVAILTGRRPPASYPILLARRDG